MNWLGCAVRCSTSKRMAPASLRLASASCRILLGRSDLDIGHDIHGRVVLVLCHGLRQGEWQQCHRQNKLEQYAHGPPLTLLGDGCYVIVSIIACSACPG